MTLRQTFFLREDLALAFHLLRSLTRASWMRLRRALFFNISLTTERIEREKDFGLKE